MRLFVFVRVLLKNLNNIGSCTKVNQLKGQKNREERVRLEPRTSVVVYAVPRMLKKYEVRVPLPLLTFSFQYY